MRAISKFMAHLALAALLLAPATPALAQSLDQMRASGQVAERFDGFVMARDGGEAAQRAVERVNAQRRQIYAKRAAEQGVDVGQVGRVYAEEVFRKAPDGTYFLQENGQFVRK